MEGGIVMPVKGVKLVESVMCCFSKQQGHPFLQGHPKNRSSPRLFSDIVA
jgi:hypothetical protein